jgi:methylenetetrahydrofolate reductase (NADPH)
MPELAMTAARVEIIPTEGIVAEVVSLVPAGTTITVTCLPHHGIERTMATALQLADQGCTVVPHIAARSIASRKQLARIVEDSSAAGITEFFVIGGDTAQPAGPYASSGAIMAEIADLCGHTMAMGVAGYPEGHPGIADVQLRDALLAKAELASSVVTQMCFSPAAIGSYIGNLRRAGVTLPVWAGVAGSVPRTKLMSLATKIGVGSSVRFISNKGPLGRQLLSGSRYQPGRLMAEVAALPTPPDGFHVYSFNSLTSFAPVPV